MWIIKNKKTFLIFSGILILGSLVLVFTQGLRLGIDFKGGSLIELSSKNTGIVHQEDITRTLENAGFPASVQSVGEQSFLIKTKTLTEEERSLVFKDLLAIAPNVSIDNFTTIGPSVGKELTKKAITSILLVCLFIVFFIAYAFRQVSKPISSWKYGLIAIVTLLHDIIIPTGLFVILGKVAGAEVDTLFVVALLTVLGLSVSDTIVVFDRIRENLRSAKKDETFETTVGQSIDQVFSRSINTSLTVILALLALYFFGPHTTKNFSLVLLAGMFFGTYSSIFVASPLLTLIAKKQTK